MSTEASILFDESQWPVLIIKHPAEPVDHERTIEYLSRLEVYFNRGENFLMIFDVSSSKPPTAEHRFMVATWIKSNRERIKPHFLGTAFVMPNMIQRLVLRTFLKFMETTEIISPVEVFNSMNKAMTWAEERIKNSVREELKM